nr:MAG TPA: hypothetical protein [Caudoviricetes sp.]
MHKGWLCLFPLFRQNTEPQSMFTFIYLCFHKHI